MLSSSNGTLNNRGLDLVGVSVYSYTKITIVNSFDNIGQN